MQVTDLYQNCLKLASENKINKNNTWSLGLIDHLSDLVKPADSEGRSTNFQVGVNRAAWCGIHLWGCALRAAVHSVRAMLWLETGLPLV